MEQQNQQHSHPKNIHYYMHQIHRWLGFFFIGLIIVYAVSGIALTYRTTNFLKTEKPASTKTIAANLSGAELGQELKIKNFSVKEENDQMVVFNNGSYNKQTGEVSYVTREYIFPVNKFVQLHMTSSKNGIHWFTMLFGIVLFLLAVTSLFMTNTKSPHFRQNMIITAAGVVFTIILLIVL